MIYSRIVSTGGYLPPRCLTNSDLVSELSNRGVVTSDEWIVERTGITKRHFADVGMSCSDLAYEASLRALADASLKPSDIDLILVATSTPDMIFPSTATILQKKLGIKNGSPAFDLQAVCSGFIYALTVADALIKTGVVRRALVVGSEVFSRILDFKDRTTCVLFGDGAGVVILEAANQPGILSCDVHADGQHLDILCTPGTICSGEVLGDPTLKMDGPAVFKLAVTFLESSARQALLKVNMTESQIDWLIPHQANLRILQSVAKRLQLSQNKLVVTVDQHANTSAATIPLALDVAIRDGRIQRGHHLMLSAVGGGFTWGSVFVRY